MATPKRLLTEQEVENAIEAGNWGRCTVTMEEKQERGASKRERKIELQSLLEMFSIPSKMQHASE